MPIVIPHRLAEILAQNHGLEADVRKTVDASQAILGWSRLPLFPDYTDHGIDHVNAVLVTTASLLKEDSWSLMSPADVALLVVAVLLHDLGMHISEDGFSQLVNTDPAKVVVDTLDHAPWPTLWRNYLTEATRFDQRKLKQLFNSTDPVHTPPPDVSLWTKRDRLIAGEFVRRHHPRLAHEAAIRGIPTGDAFFLPVSGLDGLSGLAGLIARSHGSQLREMFPFLIEKYHLREYQGAHSVFLMVLLRIADYLQIEGSRAPSNVLMFKKLTSPFSKIEWLAHAAVENVSFLENDPEAMDVRANPTDVRTFLRLQRWLSDFQQELDVSWAVLGEVYGRIPPVDRLGIVLRRVRSNIDDTLEFSKHVRFVPTRVAFEAADADLLKLLVSPLYGDRPEVGIRELLQNAVDAVREANRVFPRGATPQTAPIRITLELNSKGESWLTVEDDGIGMNAEIVREYFLKAGASFRRSSAWREHFEDASGHSSVLRSGRFGVGAIATFLLGDEIEVRTRRADELETSGISFHARLDDDIVELERRSNPRGTLIRIRMRPEVARRFLSRNEYEESQINGSWDWYCLADPQVERRCIQDGREQLLKQNYNLPNVNDVLPEKYARTAHPKFDDIQWTYADAPVLVCNGIIVKNKKDLTRRSERLYRTPSATFFVAYPNLSVFDSDGWLPLNLQRTELTTPHYPFTPELRADVTEYLASFMVNAGPALHIADVGGLEAHGLFDHPALGRRAQEQAYSPYVDWGYTVSTAVGFTLATPRHLCEVVDESVVVVPFQSAFHFPTGSKPEFGQALALDREATAITVQLSIGIGDLHNLLRTGLYAVSSSYSSAYRKGTPFGDRKFIGCRVHMTTWFSDHYVPKLQRKVSDSLVVERLTSDVKIVTIGEVGPTKVDLTRLPRELLGRSESAWPGLILEWYFKPEHFSAVETDDITEHWARIVGETVIPYDATRRSEISSRLGNIGLRSAAFANTCRSNLGRQVQTQAADYSDIDSEDISQDTIAF